MPMRELIQEIKKGWPDYHDKKRVDGAHHEYDLVVRQFPKVLDQYLSDYKNKLVKGSTGTGNINDAPWIAIFDQRLTTSATREYYPVYLFSVDMSSVTLALAFGTTQFMDLFLTEEEAFPRMRSAALRLQEMFNHLIPAYLERGPIHLAAKPSQELHYAYQQSSILSFPPYAIDALPEESRLKADLRELFHLYAEIVSDPLDANVDRIVEAVADPAPLEQTSTVLDFVPRPPAKRGKRGGGQGHRRHSSQSRKVGDAGELAVVNHEQKRLRETGHPELADRVQWHGQKREFLGWDITSFDDRGEEFLIEVKSCAGAKIFNVDLTVNEWQAACHQANRHRYCIYLVTNALSANPRIEVLRNPAAFVESKTLSCDPIVYELQLRSSAAEMEKEPSPQNAAELPVLTS
jgi:hypothetical protein